MVESAGHVMHVLTSLKTHHRISENLFLFRLLRIRRNRDIKQLWCFSPSRLMKVQQRQSGPREIIQMSCIILQALQ